MSDPKGKRPIPDGRGAEYPTDYDDWPVERRVDWLVSIYSRRAIISKVLHSTHLEPDRAKQDKRLNKNELAAILVSLQ